VAFKRFRAALEDAVKLLAERIVGWEADYVFVGDAVIFFAVEAEFEYVTGEYSDGGKIFRKRK
jgi:hypothetical protein